MNKKILFIMLAVALVLGMTLVGCNDSAGGGGSLNGTWVSDDDVDYVYIFTSGNLELKIAGESFAKGTYTTSGSNITMTVTHVWLGSWMALTPEIMEMLDIDSATETMTYSVNGNKLTIEGDTFTKQ
jgi:uncharacterized lipoprotein NlpE involved in copper resistance